MSDSGDKLLEAIKKNIVKENKLCLCLKVVIIIINIINVKNLSIVTPPNGV